MDLNQIESAKFLHHTLPILILCYFDTSWTEALRNFSSQPLGQEQLNIA